MSERTSYTALLALGFLLVAVAAGIPKLDTAGGRRDGVRNVHIVCHTHDDPGWLKTVDQYHYGSNNSIQVAGTQYILDSVVASLLANPDRTFVYGEMAFFIRWWREQGQHTRHAVRRLVAEGRLSFVNGGYVQNDEAAAHYVAMIDQTTRGHTFLKDTFNVTPTVGWQLDPFGHSATQAVFSALYGFDAQFFGRADYQDMERRKARKEMELLWRGARSFGADADIFTGNFASGNYGPPPGFNWDWGQADPQIQDDRRLHDYNVGDRLNAFVHQCERIFNVTRGKDIMLTMGTDFTYANAHAWYKNLDKLIHYAKRDGRLNVFYSSPMAYAAAKNGHKQDGGWPLKTDDFFPYADCPHCYWTGYFTSRAAAKGYVRRASSYLQAARQLEVAAGIDPDGPSTDALEEAVSLAQHHDAVTGTAKQHVADDYNMRIAAGMAEAEKVVENALVRLLHGRLRHKADGAGNGNGRTAVESGARSTLSEAVGPVPAVGAVPVAAAKAAGAAAETPPLLAQCGLLNISVCGASVAATRAGRGFTVAIYNPLAWRRRHHVRIPITGGGHWAVTDDVNEAVAAQQAPISASTRRLQNAAAEHGAVTDKAAIGDAELAFAAELPPLGLAVYHVRPAEEGTRAAESCQPTSMPGGAGRQPVSVGSGTSRGPQLELVDGRVSRLRVATLHTELNPTLRWYNSSDGADGAIASGAYIFRPNGSYAIQQNMPTAPEVVDGPVMLEIRSAFSDWAQLTTRVWKDAPHVEVEWTVGPIPIGDDLGKEVVLQCNTSLDSGAAFSTDANGREMQARVRNQRPTWELNVTEPIAGNFYPVTTAIEIEERGKSVLAVLPDRSQAGASLAPGQIELMLHRRLLHDDARGVGEPLNETACGCRDCSCDGLIVRGTHTLTFEEPERAAELRRTTQSHLADPPLLAFAAHGANWQPVPVRAEQAAPAIFEQVEALPRNVQLLTLKATGPDSLLLRLAHLYQIDEDAELSKVAEVDLTKLLRAVSGVRSVTSVEEMALGGATALKDIQRLHWKEGQPLRQVGRSGGSGAGVSAGLQQTGRADTGAAAGLAAVRQGPVGCSGGGCECGKRLRVALGPMEIRTFSVQLGSGGSGSVSEDR